MTRGDVELRIRTIVVDVLACDPDQFRDDADFREDLGADSLDLVELPAALEDEFAIQISDDEAEACKTVGAAIDIIAAKVEQLLWRQCAPAIGRSTIGTGR